MSSKEFCESGKHVYRETDIVASIFQGMKVDRSYGGKVWIVVACSKCDSKFLRVVEEPLP